MPSAAFAKYSEVAVSASVLRRAKPSRAQKLGQQEKQRRIYQSSLAAFVASWDAYVNQLIPDFYSATAPMLSPALMPIHDIARNMAARRLERFNTPNSENTREQLVMATGYDPWPDWNWGAAGMSSLEVRQRLNEIVKVRHSFAHGFSMPAFGWNQTSLGVVRVDGATVDWIDKFFRFLVNATDRGMYRYIRTTFGIVLPWY